MLKYLLCAILLISAIEAVNYEVEKETEVKSVTQVLKNFLGFESQVVDERRRLPKAVAKSTKRSTSKKAAKKAAPKKVAKKAPAKKVAPKKDTKKAGPPKAKGKGNLQKKATEPKFKARRLLDADDDDADRRRLPKTVAKKPTKKVTKKVAPKKAVKKVAKKAAPKKPVAKKAPVKKAKKAAPNKRSAKRPIKV